MGLIEFIIGLKFTIELINFNGLKKYESNDYRL